MTHSIYGPSTLHRLIPCPGSITYAGLEGGSSALAAEGSAAHELGALCLTTNTPATDYLDKEIAVDGHVFKVDDDMAMHVQWYVDRVKQIAAGAPLMVEQAVAFGKLVGLDTDDTGTLDVAAIIGPELFVGDLKYGRGVRVEADDNPQLLTYAAAVYNDIGFLIGVERIRLVIFQPRLNHISEWTCTPKDLQEHLLVVQNAIERSKLPEPPREAGEDQCKFCAGKANGCRTFIEAALEPVFNTAPATADEFDNLKVPDARYIKPTTDDWLAAAMSKVDLIEQWCRSVRAEVEARLTHGTPISGWKLVKGRQGPRKWVNATDAEQMIRKVFRLKVEDAYDLTLISPTSAEKLAKTGTIGAKQWAKLQPLIIRAEGGLSVAPASDDRPAVDMTVSVDEFKDESDMSDLV